MLRSRLRSKLRGQSQDTSEFDKVIYTAKVKVRVSIKVYVEIKVKVKGRDQ